MSKHERRIQKLEDEAAITDLIGNLTDDEKTREANKERSERSRALAEEQKRRDAQKN